MTAPAFDLSPAAPPAPPAAGPVSGPAEAAALDPSGRNNRLVHLFRDSRAAGEVHPLEHLLRCHRSGGRT